MEPRKSISDLMWKSNMDFGMSEKTEKLFIAVGLSGAQQMDRMPSPVPALGPLVVMNE